MIAARITAGLVGFVCGAVGMGFLIATAEQRIARQRAAKRRGKAFHAFETSSYVRRVP